MSGPKSYTVVDDPETLRRRAEELRRREQELYDAMAGTLRESLSDEELALCERVENRNRAIDAINRQSCELLRGRAVGLNARFEQAARARAALLDRDSDFPAPALPSAIDKGVLNRTEPTVLQTAIDALEQSLQTYEEQFVQARQVHLGKINSGALGSAAARAAGVSCYSSELQSVADDVEQRVSGTRLASLRRQRSEADEIVLNATKNLGVALSAEAMESYRDLLASDDVGARKIQLTALRQRARDDAVSHRAASAQAARLESERLAIDKRSVLTEVCREMGWRVIMGNSSEADRIYVAEKGFANHLRELRLEQDRDGSTRLSIRPLEIEGATRRVRDKTKLDTQYREFNLSLCGKDGTLNQFKELLKSNAISLEQARRDVPPQRPPVALDKLPNDMRKQLIRQGEKPAPDLQATIPRK